MKNLLAWFMIIAGVCMGWVAWHGIVSGTVTLKFGGKVALGDEPIAFWIKTGFDTAIALVLLVFGAMLILRGKK